ncbi:MAG: biotin synthase, partial [Gammaproteobacteria bacterium]|nr:biotin synthase [Gammaproteobacteria bacterium]
VMDMERIVLTWADPDAALAELRSLGRNLHRGRFAGLRGRGWRESILGGLQETALAAEGSGRIAFTFEVIYGHAFKPAARVALSPESAVSLREMRSMLRQKRPDS